MSRGRHAAAVRRRRLHAHASAAVATAVTLAMTHGVNPAAMIKKKLRRAKAVVLFARESNGIIYVVDASKGALASHCIIPPSWPAGILDCFTRFAS